MKQHGYVVTLIIDGAKGRQPHLRYEFMSSPADHRASLKRGLQRYEQSTFMSGRGSSYMLECYQRSTWPCYSESFTNLILTLRKCMKFTGNICTKPSMSNTAHPIIFLLARLQTLLRRTLYVSSIIVF